jgi:hypothetical protein
LPALGAAATLQRPGVLNEDAPNPSLLVRVMLAAWVEVWMIATLAAIKVIRVVCFISFLNAAGLSAVMTFVGCWPYENVLSA